MQEQVKTKFKKSSGNIFKDLGYDNPDETLAKVEIAIKINDIIAQKKLKQKEAAKILGIDQPKISALRNGRLRGFSFEKLLKFLNALNYDVEIRIRNREVMHSAYEVCESA
jgi:predicted XRE-type DNA-binding protein